MDTIPEKEQPKEQRRGVAPFAKGSFEDLRSDSDIESKPFMLGEDLFVMLLRKPDIEGDANEDSRGYTIDRDGIIKTGNLRDFFRSGYRTVFLYSDRKGPEQMTALDDDQYQQYAEGLKVNLWLEGNEKIISAEPKVTLNSHPADDFIGINFSKYSKKDSEEFVLPSNPEILQAIRLNVTNV